MEQTFLPSDFSPFSFSNASSTFTATALGGTRAYCPPECSAWAFDYFGDCVCSFRDWISFFFGLVSVFSWAVAEIPQIITNFFAGTTEGISLLFLMTWTFGDAFNVVGCYLEPATLPTQFWMAVMYTITTIVLVVQTAYYDFWVPKKEMGEVGFEGGIVGEETLSRPLLEEAPPTQPIRMPSGADVAVHADVALSASRMISVPLSRKSSTKDIYITSARSLASSHTPTMGSFLPGSFSQSHHPPHSHNHPSSSSSSSSLHSNSSHSSSAMHAGSSQQHRGGSDTSFGFSQAIAAAASSSAQATSYHVGSLLSQSPGQGAPHISIRNLPGNLQRGGANAPPNPSPPPASPSPFSPSPPSSPVSSSRSPLASPSSPLPTSSARPSPRSRLNGFGFAFLFIGTLHMSINTLSGNSSSTFSLALPSSLSRSVSLSQSSALTASASSSKMSSFSNLNDHQNSDFIGSNVGKLNTKSLEIDSSSSSSSSSSLLSSPFSRRLLQHPLLFSSSLRSSPLFSWTGAKDEKSVDRARDSESVSEDEEESSPLGELLGWFMAAIYMGGRLPQIWLNMERGTVEGLSPLMFIFALVGNATYVASILVRSMEWKRISPNMPWLVDAAVCVLLDFFILGQFVYYAFAKQEEDDVEEFEAFK